MATVRIQLRRGTSDQWFGANPTLAAGEIGIETDTNTFKFGDGITAWNDLSYALSDTVDDYIPINLKGVANGVAELDSNGYVPAAQLPPLAKVTVNAVADQAARLALTVEPGDIAIQADNGTTYVLQSEPASTNANWKEISATAAISAAISAHESDTTNVHGIADTSILVTTTGTQTLSSKTLSSPALTGTPTAPTAANGTDTTQIATTEFVQNAIELVVGAAPSALDTLAEIAQSLNDDADLAGTLTTAISEKVAKSGDTMSGSLNMGTNKITSLGTPTVNTDAATKGYVDLYIQTGIDDHNSVTTGVHGISNTADLVVTSDSRLIDERVPLNLSVATAKIVDFAVTTPKLQDLGVTAEKIQDAAIGTSKLSDNAVTNAKIADDSISSDKISDNSIVTSKIANSAVTSDKIADESIVNSKLAANAVESSNILDAAVTESKLQDDSISTIKIVDLNVTTAKLADGSVTEGKLATDAVTSGKIADGSVTSAKIANGTIVDGDISASAEIAQSKVFGLTSDLDAKAPLAGPTFTGTVTLPSTTSIGNVSSTELGYLDGVTSGLQTQLDAKASAASLSSHESDTSTHGVGTIVGTSETQTLTNKTISAANNTITVQVANVSDLTASAAELNVLDGITASTSELNILDGVTASALELNVLDGITASTAELNYVDGVTSSIQTQIDGKASLSGAVFTGSVEIDQNLVVDGNLTVNGTTFSASSTSITIEDNLVQLAHQNPANTVDLGIVVGYNDGTAKHAGIVRDVSADKWKLFKGVTTEPATTVDFTQGSLDDIEVAGLTASSATIGDVSNTELQYLNGVTSSVQTQLDAKAPLAGPTFTGTVTLPSTTSIGNVSSTELGYLDGVTSGLQTQLDAKAPKDAPTFTGTVTVAAAGIAFTDGTQTKQGVPSITAITEKTANYTLSSLTERDTLIEVNHTGGTAVTITVPADSTVNFPIGTSIDILRTNTGEVTIAGSGATVNATPGLKLRDRWSSATLFKRGANSWVLFGDLKA